MSEPSTPIETVPFILLPDPAELPPGFAPLRLVLLPGATAVMLNRTEVIVGRHSSCHVRLPLPDVSRRHCRFWFDNGEWWVEDLASMNGIMVNGQRVLRRRLNLEDEIRIGGFTFVVRSSDAEGQILRTIAEAIPQRQAS